MSGTEAPGPVRSEEVTDIYGTYEMQWFCQPPPEGAEFYVTRCTWTPDHKVRKVYEIKLGSP